MPKGAYVGINNVARKIKKGYVGVNGVARRIRKAYIGIGGVARPCWSYEELVYYGKLSDVSVYAGNGASTNKYAIFSGSTSSSYVYAIDKDLVRHTSLNNSRRDNTGCTSVGEYVLFAGGSQSSGDEGNNDATYSTVTAIDNSLTVSMLTNLNSSKGGMTGTTLCNYAIFGGGYRYSSTSGAFNYSLAEIYDNQLTKISTSANFGYSSGSASATLGQYAIAAGGGLRGSRTVYVCDTSLTNISVDFLSEDKTDLAAASVGDYILFAGGVEWDGYGIMPASTVDVYDTNLTKFMTSSLSSAKSNFGGTTFEDYAIFSDGATYDVYDSYLTHKSGDISSQKSAVCATTIGYYAIFAGEGNPHVFTIA